MSADVTVLRDDSALVGAGVSEDLEDRLLPAAEKAVFWNGCAGVHTQVLAHPVAVVLERAQRVEVLAAEHVHQEPCRLLEIGHSQSNVIDLA